MGRSTTMCATEVVLVVGLEMHSRLGSQRQGEVPEWMRSCCPRRFDNALGLPSSQLSTTVLSVQACVLSNEMFNARRTMFTRSAPHSSRRGIDSCLMGATLDLLVTRVTEA